MKKILKNYLALALIVSANNFNVQAIEMKMPNDPEDLYKMTPEQRGELASSIYKKNKKTPDNQLLNTTNNDNVKIASPKISIEDIDKIIKNNPDQTIFTQEVINSMNSDQLAIVAKRIRKYKEQEEAKKNENKKDTTIPQYSYKFSGENELVNALISQIIHVKKNSSDPEIDSFIKTFDNCARETRIQIILNDVRLCGNDIILHLNNADHTIAKITILDHHLILQSELITLNTKVSSFESNKELIEFINGVFIGDEKKNNGQLAYNGMYVHNSSQK